MRFSQVVGQSKLIQDLVKMVHENRVGHAMLFSGPAGYGGLPLALGFSQYMSCQQRTDVDSCGTCPSCLKYEKLVHPDLHFVFPVNTTKRITKDPVSDDFLFEWRAQVLENPYFDENVWYQNIGIENKQGLISKNESSGILKKLQLKTFESDYKVMITWLPEKMNQTSANKLLKIIEEPPPGTLFLLVTENQEQLLTTILSRCHRIQLPRIASDVIHKALQLKYPDAGGLEEASHMAQGDFRLALDYMKSKDENGKHFEMFIQLMRMSFKQDIAELISWSETISGMGREQQKEFIRYALKMVRENFLITVAETAVGDLVRQDQKEKSFSEKFAPFINEKNIEGITSELNEVHRHIASNAYPRIVFLDLALRMSKLIRL